MLGSARVFDRKGEEDGFDEGAKVELDRFMKHERPEVVNRGTGVSGVVLERCFLAIMSTEVPPSIASQHQCSSHRLALCAGVYRIKSEWYLRVNIIVALWLNRYQRIY